MENTRRKVFPTESADYRWRGLYIVSGILMISLARLMV